MAKQAALKVLLGLSFSFSLACMDFSGQILCQPKPVWPQGISERTRNFLEDSAIAADAHVQRVREQRLNLNDFRVVDRGSDKQMFQDFSRAIAKKIQSKLR
jgi:hypothetical protein